MARSRVPSIGVDPDFAVTAELCCDVHLARTSSDEFFARKRPLAHLPTGVLDLAFVDGMHLAEYALRDFLAVERFTHPASVVVLDDVLPRNVVEASRIRSTVGWTGDVYKAVAALREHRPDLLVLEVDTDPTGVAVVLRPDATLDGVAPWYDEWVTATVTSDPQDVPEVVLRRDRAWQPRALLDLDLWGRLAELRESTRSRAVGPVAELLTQVRQPAQAR